MRRFRARAVEAAAAITAAIAMGARGGALTARRGLHGLAIAAGDATAGREGAASVLAVALARLLVQLPLDALLLLLARALSALQTLLGLEALARPLDPQERAVLAAVFGDGLELRRVRIKEGSLGLLGLPGRAFVVGDTVHVPGPPRGSLSTAAALLVHEATHLWQHQRHGTRYLSECLLAQWLGEGYNVAVALAAGRRRFAGLNFEQQAELLEQAYRAGWFDRRPAGAPRRLLFRLTDRRRDDGFAVARATEQEAARLQAAGWLDATAVLADGLAEIRARSARSRAGARP